MSRDPEPYVDELAERDDALLDRDAERFLDDWGMDDVEADFQCSLSDVREGRL